MNNDLELAKQKLLESAKTYIDDIAGQVTDVPRVRVAAAAMMSLLEVFKREGIQPHDIFAEFPRAADRRKAQN